MLLKGLEEPDGREAIRVGDDALSYEQLHAAAGAVAERIAGATRVAVTAETKLETVVAVVGALAAGVPITPVNPKAGEREREHILSDSAPDVMLDDVDLTASATGRSRRTTKRPRSSSTRRGRPARRRASCSRTARSPPTSTRSPTPGTGPARTSSRTACRSSTSTA